MSAWSKLRTMRELIKTLNFCLLFSLISLSAITPVKAAPDEMVIPRKGGAGTGGIEVTTSFTPASVFPHWIHRLRFRCDACHDSLFEMKLGASDISMGLMKEGKSCGICHSEKTNIAFPVSFETCDRCHREPSE
jgi:c(7)-type cytochrome triheme protein